MAIEVITPGLLTTVQDRDGRPGYQRYGVPHCGALDPLAAAAANVLVGNDPNAPLLEITLSGPTLRFEAATTIGLAGADLSADLDGQPLRPGWSWLVRPGATLTFGERRSGARTYLATAGGLQVPSVLGSPAADVRAGFGGLAGRALRAGDRLDIARVSDAAALAGAYLAAGSNPDVSEPVRVLPGPHVDRFEPGSFEALCSTTWEISEQADRMGYRLLGPDLRHQHGADVASLGLPLGTIQVPGDGRPIVLLADHQPTGGYTVLGCTIQADLHVLAQRAPGDQVRFVATTEGEARAALCAQRADLARVTSDAAVWAALRLVESVRFEPG